MSGKAHCRAETRQGGLLLGVEAPSLVFRHNWGARVVKTAPSRVSTRDGAMGGACGDVSSALGKCQWG